MGDVEYFKATGIGSYEHSKEACVPKEDWWCRGRHGGICYSRWERQVLVLPCFPAIMGDIEPDEIWTGNVTCCPTRRGIFEGDPCFVSIKGERAWCRTCI